MKFILAAIIIIHGLIHLLGFLKAFNISEINQLTLSISKTAGILWLLTVLLFIIDFILLILNNNKWWMIGLAATLISQILISNS